MMALHTLLYLIYGTNRAYHLELTYSVLSAHRFLKSDPQGVEIVLISDAANARPDLPVTPVIVTDAQLKSWQLDGSYDYAAKIAALGHALDLGGGPCALIDTDTIFTTHPARLFDRIKPGQSLMHANEGPLTGLREWPAYESALRAAGGQLAEFRFDEKATMYNSGICGLHPSDRALLVKVSAVLDALRPLTDVFTAEQFATGLVLSSGTTIVTAQDLVTHYWDGPRAYYLYQMARFWPSVAQGGGLVDANAPLPTLRRRPEPAMSDRLRARAVQWRRSNDRAYAHAYLCALSALRSGPTDPEMGSIWAEMAHDVLHYGMGRQRDETGHDFQAFTPQTLDRLTWLTPKVQAKWRSYWADLNTQ